MPARAAGRAPRRASGRGMFGERSTRLSPTQPETGTTCTGLASLSTLKPALPSRRTHAALTSSKRASSYRAASILFTATTTCRTPSTKASSACSRAMPSPETAASNAPAAAGTTSSAASACEAPRIMFLTKSRWPGASIRVTARLPAGVRSCARDRSIVRPRARSAAKRSISHAYLKEAFPAASHSRARRASASSPAPAAPHRLSSAPAVVDLPASTLPITTRLRSAGRSPRAAATAPAAARAMQKSSRRRLWYGKEGLYSSRDFRARGELVEEPQGPYYCPQQEFLNQRDTFQREAFSPGKSATQSCFVRDGGGVR